MSKRLHRLNEDHGDRQSEKEDTDKKKTKVEKAQVYEDASLPGIYMDYQATTPLEDEVLDTISVCLKEAWGNPSSCYVQGKKAKDKIEEARTWIAKMINSKKTDILFTSGGTESNNMVLQTALKYMYKIFPSAKTKPSDRPHIVTSNIEHDSIANVLKHFEREGLADITYVPVSNETGHVEVDAILNVIQARTCLVTLMMVNNETGIIQPIADICKAVKSLKRDEEHGMAKILLHTDAAQAIGKIPVDVSALGVDYLTIVGHKIYGPRIGALYWNNSDETTPLYPLLYGGGQERNYRSGTENTGMIAGLGKAAELVCLNLQEYTSHMTSIRDYFEKKLQEAFGEDVVFNGKFNKSERTPTVCNVSFTGCGLLGYQILSRCQQLQASVGAACHSGQQHKPSPILLAIGVSSEVAGSAVRLSIGRHTTRDDIDMVIKDLLQACDKNRDKS